MSDSDVAGLPRQMLTRIADGLVDQLLQSDPAMFNAAMRAWSAALGWIAETVWARVKKIGRRGDVARGENSCNRGLHAHCTSAAGTLIDAPGGRERNNLRRRMARHTHKTVTPLSPSAPTAPRLAGQLFTVLGEILLLIVVGTSPAVAA
jgi:hypothetical protein